MSERCKTGRIKRFQSGRSAGGKARGILGSAAGESGMLEGLERIDWSGLAHAYGPATDVPGLIRSLADGSEEVRDEAIDGLFGNIAHQGSLYAATAPAVPFLIELVGQSGTPGREHVLGLLQSISQGWLDCLHYATRRTDLSPSVAERQARELSHYQSAHAAVEEGFAVFARLLEDSEIAVRIGAAFVVATMIDSRADAAKALLEAIDSQREARCRGALLLALMVLAGQRPGDAVAEAAVRRFETVFDDERAARAARLGAGIALLRTQRQDAIPRVLALARQHVATDREIFRDLPWDEANDLFALVDASLTGVPQARIEWIIEGLRHPDPAVRKASIYCGSELCHERRGGPAALHAHFAGLVDDASTDIRKEAIQALAGMGRLGVKCLNGLGRRALPDVRAEAAESLKRVRSHERDRAAWLAEKRPLFLPSVSRLLKTIARHQGSHRFDDAQRVRDAVVCLGFHGPKAAAAAEALRGLFGHESPWIRVHAIRALWKITRDPELVVPLLLKNLHPEPAAFLILDCLKQIGPGAGEALPQLRRIIDSEERYITSGLRDGICADDEAFRDLSLEVVQAIERAP
jgi:hypothetical protein